MCRLQGGPPRRGWRAHFPCIANITPRLFFTSAQALIKPRSPRFALTAVYEEKTDGGIDNAEQDCRKDLVLAYPSGADLPEVSSDYHDAHASAGQQIQSTIHQVPTIPRR
jgi:hypothetical protein